MPTVETTTAVHPFRRVYATNVTATAYVSKPDLITLPSVALVDSTGYLDLGIGRLSATTPDSIMLKFYGVGADNTTGNCRIYGLKEVCTASGVRSYTHVLLADYALTYSASTGVADGGVLNTERYADTITRTFGIENVADQLLSPANDVAGHDLLDVKGVEYIHIEPIRGTATSVNVLYGAL